MKELVYGRALLPAVERHGDRVGFVDAAYQATWQQHLRRVLQLSRTLRDGLGVRPDEHFAVLAANGHRYLECYHAAGLGAGVICPLNPRLTPADLAYILDDAEARVVVVDDACAPLLARTLVLRTLPTVVVHATGTAGDGVLSAGPRIETVLDYEQALAAADATLLPEPEENDPVVLMYTGGTTGRPKGTLITQRAEMLNLYHAAGIYRAAPGRTYLHQGPLFHASAITAIFGFPVHGGCTATVPGFDVPTVLSVSREIGVTDTGMIPTMIAMLLDHPEFDPAALASWRWMVYGASPMPQVLMERLADQLPHVDLHQGYGMTEAAQWVSCLDAEDHRRGGPRLRSAGRAVPGVRVAVRDADGRFLPAGGPGEICAQGGNFMTGYWKLPEETAEALRDGWYHTGDAGYIDDDGYIYLVDRIKDVIVTGGENVYSSEVENVLAAHPAVAQVAVIGLPHPVWVECVHAVVVLRSGATCEAAELIAHARRSLAGYKVPKTVEFRETPLPLSGVMKVRKRELREQAMGASA